MTASSPSSERLQQARGLRSRRPGRPPQRPGERERDDDRQEPPGVDAKAGQDSGEHEPEADRRRDDPIVADDEVPPETAKRAHVAHAPAPAVAAERRWRRRERTRPKESAPTNAITARRDSSSPGQSTPAPSAAQKMPKLVSRRPTANLIVFSGTRSRGPRASSPAATTITTAAAAPRTAGPK